MKELATWRTPLRDAGSVGGFSLPKHSQNCYSILLLLFQGTEAGTDVTFFPTPFRGTEAGTVMTLG